MQRPRQKVGSTLGMKVFAVMMRIFPRRVVYAFTIFPVLWYFLSKAEIRVAASAFLARVDPSAGRWRRFFFGLTQSLAYSHVILDNMYLGVFGPKKFYLEKKGTEVFLDVLAAGNGLILLSAHVGNWHLAVNFLSNTQTQVHLVIDDARQEEVRRQMDVAKESSAHLTVHDGSEGPDLIFTISAALRRGEVVIFAGDRVTTGRKAQISFLGQSAWFPTTAYAISKVTKAPICTALALRTGMQRYVCLGFGPLGGKDDALKAQRGELERSLASEFAAHLESSLRGHPEQWFNFYDFWQTEDKS